MFSLFMITWFYDVVSVEDVEPIVVNPLVEPVKALNKEIRPDTLSFYDLTSSEGCCYAD
jgi:hypothetical protein